ncbi:hypothetical protein [Kitasatospora sp. NPDC008115]|uniref:hypothetical protein n=1 Tax=Kitasatospora sp. NPDC008115 TaxID=3364022 RepID=UPI0036E6D5CB
MAVRRPVDGEVRVHYRQIYVESDPGSSGPGLAEAFAGQDAGLCGAAIPGALFLVTGLHTGSVRFTVEVHDTEPSLDPVWEDIVEVSFRPASHRSRLVQWAGEATWDLDLEELDYRVRYCAHGMDEGRGRDTRLPGEPLVDRYLLQLWPAPPGPERVLRQTAEIAAYWHDYARRLPPPPTAEDRARERRAQDEATRQRREALERWQWGGTAPSDALRGVGGNVRGLLAFDAPLVHALEAAGPRIQRQVALLAARRACTVAGLADLDWVAAALTALTDGRPLPPPFDDPARMWQALASDPRAPRRTVGPAMPPENSSSTGTPISSTPVPTEEPGPSRRVSQSHMALPALLGAAALDPLRASVEAVLAAVAAYGEDHQVLLEEVWSVVSGQ